MKNKNRKRKYVVALESDSETNSTALTKGIGSVDVRIRASGKIRNYVAYITKALTESPEQKVCVYAEGTETCKLATILEILKRSLTQLTSKLTIGNTISSPCSRREKEKKGTDLDELQPKSGIYGKNLLKSFTTTAPPSGTKQQQSNAKETTVTTNDKDRGSSDSVWMLAELRNIGKD